MNNFNNFKWSLLLSLRIALFNSVLLPYDLAYKLWHKTISIKEILQLDNMEYRMTALSVIGVDKIVKYLKAKKIDENDRGDKLFKGYNKDLLDNEIKIGQYKDFSTDRVYFAFALPEHKTIDEFLAWKHWFSLEEWHNCLHA